MRLSFTVASGMQPNCPLKPERLVASQMDPQQIGEILSEWAKGKPLVKRIFLFGSRVRGDNRPDSDIDIAVELDPVAFQCADDSGGLATWMFETQGWKGALQKLIPIPVQLERYHPNQTPTVASGLERSSTLVYEKAT